MKRLLMTTIASLMIAGSFSLPAVAQQSRGGHSSQHGAQNGQGDHADRGNRGARPGQPNGATQLQGQPGQNRGARPGQPQQSQQAQQQYRGGDHNQGADRNRNFADNRGNDHRYDNRNDRRYNNNRTRGASYGWARHDWRRGDYLGDWSRRYYEIDYRDYRAYRLYDPPYGYHWVRDDNGDFLLAALAGGLIATIIAGSY
ncbi:MAG: RcnB family protein [Alphaproteobacteria bacterium]